MTNKTCHALFSPSKWPMGCHFMECCCNYTNAEKDSCFILVSTVVFSCVAANVCYYFECYSIICYVDKQHIRSVLLTATTLFNVMPVYRVCEHVHYSLQS